MINKNEDIKSEIEIKMESVKLKVREYILEASLSTNADIKNSTLIFDEGLLDSMGLLFLIEFLSENFNIEVDDDELNPSNFGSIDSIVSFVSIKTKQNRNSI